MCKEKKKSNYKSSELLDIVKDSILPLYNLDNALIEEVKVKDTEKHRAVYKILDNENTYCLKKVYYSEESLLFVYSVVEWLYRKGIKVPNFLPSLANDRFVSYKDLLFILTPWIEGTKCNLDEDSCISNTAKTLAKLHKSTKNFKPIPGSYKKENFDNLYISTEKHFTKLLECFNEAQKRKDKFSKLFIKTFDNNMELAKISLEISSSINFKNLSVSLCHGDYVNKNLVCKDNDIWVIDFDKCSLNYSIFDVSYFFRRLLKRNSSYWDIEIAKKFLLTYNEISPCTKDDIKYLLAYIAFPQKYWRVSKDYYNNIKKCNKIAFLDILSNNVKSIEPQKKFVSEFYNFCLKEFDL
ncbi:MAG: CotS family spore coat protein [Sarcina sp.]